MAGLFDEFDDATPLRHSFCGRISKEAYERQAAESTESAIEELMEYLEANPDAYTDVVKKRRKEEAESAGLLSYLKVQLFSLWSGSGNTLSQPTEQECKAELRKMREDIIKVYEYSQGALTELLRVRSIKYTYTDLYQLFGFGRRGCRVRECLLLLH